MGKKLLWDASIFLSRNNLKSISVKANAIDIYQYKLGPFWGIYTSLTNQ